MSQRQVTLTNTVRDLTGAPIPFAPVSFQLLTPGGVTAIDGNGDGVQTAKKSITTDINGAYSQAVDYPGDFQSAYQASQIRVTENGIITDSPISFAYASSIAVTTWYAAPSTTGLVTMRFVLTDDTGAAAVGVGIHTSINQLAIVVASGATRTTQQVSAVTDSTGTVRFSLDPQSALNPNTTTQTLSIDGESGTFTYKVPDVADNYRGAWNGATAYVAATGTSNGDVVLSGGVLYRCILAHTNHVPPNATYWAVVAGLPTDLITAPGNLTAGAPVASAALSAAALSSLITPMVDDADQTAASLADDITVLNGRTIPGVRVISTSAAISATADKYIRVNAISNIAPTLPDITLRTEPYKLFRYDVTGNTCTLTPHSGNTINGAATLAILSRTGYELRPPVPGTGTDWELVSSTAGGSGTFAGEVTGTDFKATGLTGSVAAGRWVGMTASGAPTTGAHLVGDWSTDQLGKRWTCTTAGTPGTFVQEPGTGGADATTTTVGVTKIRTTASGAHPIALTTDDLNASGGVAPLDSGSKVPVPNLPDATSSTKGVARPDNTTVTVSGGVLTAIVAGGGSVISTQGDTIVGNNSGAASRQGIGRPGQSMSPVGNDIPWITPSNRGGLVDPTTADNQLLFRKATAGIAALGILFIGDSITVTVPSGGTVNPATAVCTSLSVGGLTVSATNQAIGGTATSDWLPGGSHLPGAVVAGLAAGCRIAHIMLGTNDVYPDGSGYVSATYRANILSICAYLAANGMIPVWSYSPYGVPGTFGVWTSGANTALLDTQAQIDGVVDNEHLWQGDTSAYLYFQAHTGEMVDGIHPNATGVTSYGNLWARALRPLVNALTGQTILQALTIGTGLAVTPASGGTPAILSASGGGGGGSGVGELLMQDGVSFPPVPLTTEDGTDWLWAG